ncbi:MAG TPA: response regulator transcription factor [Candidatus Hydrogenedentes bacterium]|nr:response regulator transcription factor [Candidatus Hydrogenedentota bacterium]
MSASPCGSSAAGRAGVFIVDDHPVVRKGLALLINQEQDLYVCGEAEDAAAALAAIERNPPDIVLVDISLPGVTGIDLIRQIRARCPDMAILVLSMMDESMYAERALRAGARGYVMKQEATDRLISAIHGVLRGEYCLSGEIVPVQRELDNRRFF